MDSAKMFEEMAQRAIDNGECNWVVSPNGTRVPIIYDDVMEAMGLSTGDRVTIEQLKRLSEASVERMLLNMQDTSNMTRQ